MGHHGRGNHSRLPERQGARSAPHANCTGRLVSAAAENCATHTRAYNTHAVPASHSNRDLPVCLLHEMAGCPRGSFL